MAQAQLERKEEINEEIIIAKEDDQLSNAGFRFNAQAPEFVPRSTQSASPGPVPVSGYFYPCYHLLGGTASAASDWIFIEDQRSLNYWTTNPNNNDTLLNSKDIATAKPQDLNNKIIKQVEYQFSDISVLANETLAKQISKDPEGYVPISIVASTKKIKSLTCSNLVIAEALRSSSKLIVSDDGKKVRRKHPFTEQNKEELQSRTVVVENLPEDHSHQNLEKIFRVAGSVKTVRVCHPPESNSTRPKGDFIISNKLHALVEFESTEVAERAVDKLNDEKNWRKGLRVRLLLRCSPKSVLKHRRSEFNLISDDDETPKSESVDDVFHPITQTDSTLETQGVENSPSARKAWGRGRGKARGRGRGQSHGGRGLNVSTSPWSSTAHGETSPRLKNGCKGPTMPDGTKGFTMGRGKILTS